MSTDNNKKHHVGTNIGGELYKHVIRVAGEQDRSVGSLIRVALRNIIFKHEGDKLREQESNYGNQSGGDCERNGIGYG